MSFKTSKDNARIPLPGLFYLPKFNLLPDNNAEELQSIPAWKARDDDVMICAYPKSGTHCIWEVTSMLMMRKAERIPVIKRTAMIESIAQATYDNIQSPRVLHTHRCFEFLPRDFAKRKCKIIYIMRNPKDVAVSFFNHHSKITVYNYSGKWEDYIPRFINGGEGGESWFDFALKWEQFMNDNQEYPILVTTFEDMKEDALREVNRTAKFLEIDCDQAFLQEVVDLCQFDRMKKDKNNMEMIGLWKENKPAMYRKGAVGDWKNWFTVEQNEHFDSVYYKRMKNSQVLPRYTLHNE